MRLGTRLFLLGGLLPAGVMLATFGLVDVVFHLSLERSLDRALLAQAAVESVSLFDGPERKPHLHMSVSPLVESVRPFAPEGTLFGPDGHEVVRYPPRKAGPEERRLPGAPDAEPALTTLGDGEAQRRELTVTVRSPAGPLYLLRLVASTASIAQSTAIFHGVALSAIAVAALLLFAVQAWQAKRLSTRLGVLRRHVERVQGHGHPEPLAPDVVGDEISMLREALALSTERLEHARAAQERLLADAAHELRTPLTLMRTTLDLALRKERSPDELRTALREARGEVERLAGLATQLLDTAALGHQPLERRSTALATLAAEAIEAAAAEAESKGARLRLEGESVDVPVHATSIRRALDNLLANAIRATPPGSEVVVRLTRAAGRVVVEVVDQGPGIAPAEREAVFEPFHRGPHSGPGSGLGLTLVREVARHHGGRVWVGDGLPSRLVLELPER